MAHERAIRRYRALYAHLLRLYPKPFRERFAEGMEQTFHDLCRERQAAGEGVRLFVLWAFLETSAGVTREMFSYAKSTQKDVALSALIGLLTVLPFVMLEAVTTSGFARSGFPALLFTLLWGLGVAFAFTLLAVIRTARTGEKARKDTLLLFVKVSALGLIAWLWAGLIVDQMPCFLGAGGC